MVAFIVLSPFLPVCLIFLTHLACFPFLFLFTSITVCISQASAPRMVALIRRRISRASPKSRSSSTRDRPKPCGVFEFWLMGSMSRQRPFRFCYRSQWWERWSSLPQQQLRSWILVMVSTAHAHIMSCTQHTREYFLDDWLLNIVLHCGIFHHKYIQVYIIYI